jgi:hypothetical protein
MQRQPGATGTGEVPSRERRPAHETVARYARSQREHRAVSTEIPSPKGQARAKAVEVSPGRGGERDGPGADPGRPSGRSGPRTVLVVSLTWTQEQSCKPGVRGRRVCEYLRKRVPANDAADRPGSQVEHGRGPVSGAWPHLPVSLAKSASRPASIRRVVPSPTVGGNVPVPCELWMQLGETSEPARPPKRRSRVGSADLRNAGAPACTG